MSHARLQWVTTTHGTESGPGISDPPPSPPDPALHTLTLLTYTQFRSTRCSQNSRRHRRPRAAPGSAPCPLRTRPRLPRVPDSFWAAPPSWAPTQPPQDPSLASPSGIRSSCGPSSPRVAPNGQSQRFGSGVLLFC